MRREGRREGEKRVRRAIGKGKREGGMKGKRGEGC